MKPEPDKQHQFIAYSKNSVYCGHMIDDYARCGLHREHSVHGEFPAEQEAPPERTDYEQGVLDAANVVECCGERGFTEDIANEVRALLMPRDHCEYRDCSICKSPNCTCPHHASRADLAHPEAAQLLQLDEPKAIVLTLQQRQHLAAALPAHPEADNEVAHD